MAGRQGRMTTACVSGTRGRQNLSCFCHMASQWRMLSSSQGAPSWPLQVRPRSCIGGTWTPVRLLPLGHWHTHKEEHSREGKPLHSRHVGAPLWPCYWCGDREALTVDLQFHCACAGNNYVCIWDILSGPARRLFTLSNHQKTVTCLCISPAVSRGPANRPLPPRLITGSLDCHVKMFDPDTCKVSPCSCAAVLLARSKQ